MKQKQRPENMYRQIRHPSLKGKEFDQNFCWIPFQESIRYPADTALQIIEERLHEDRMLAWELNETGRIAYAPVRYNLAFTEFHEFKTSDNARIAVEEGILLELLWIAKWTTNTKSRLMACENLKAEVHQKAKQERYQKVLELTLQELERLR